MKFKKSWRSFPPLCCLILLCITGFFCEKSTIKSFDSESKKKDKPIAEKYPHDKGIEKDPDVLFVEKFNDGLSDVLNRYQDILNSEGMSLDQDIPSGSSGSKSLKITNIGGQNSGGHLFKSFNPGFDSIVYMRYYVKYPLSSKGYIHHESIWIGGYNPILTYPYPRAGTCGINGRLSIAYEPANDSLMGTYNYWPFMKSWNGGSSCYGNDMLAHTSSPHQLFYDKWICIEIRVKLNSPSTASNGELTIWQDGKEIGKWGPGFPNGYWLKDTWVPDPSNPPFEGFQWRADPGLNINYIWIEFFDDTTPDNISHSIKYSNIVIAKKYIGPIKK
jgi:hypothetical protein